MTSENPATPVRGLDPVGVGAEHWWHERLSSVSTLLLLIWLAVSLLRLPDLSFGSVTQWLALPLNAVGMMLLIVSGFWHAKMGMQVIVEDYVHQDDNRIILLMLINFLIIAGAALALFSVLKIALGGGAA